MSEITQEERQKIASLPRWAIYLIDRLERTAALLSDAAAKSKKAAEYQRERASSLSTANEALIELLRMAGKSGLDWAKVTADVLASYEIFSSPEQR